MYLRQFGKPIDKKKFCHVIVRPCATCTARVRADPYTLKNERKKVEQSKQGNVQVNKRGNNHLLSEFYCLQYVIIR